MRCTTCGHDMPDHAKFCKMCGTPVDAEQTVSADGEPDLSADRTRADASARDYDLSMFEDDGKEPRPRRRRDAFSEDTGYHADRHSDSEPRYDDDYNDRSGSEPHYDDDHTYYRSDRNPRYDDYDDDRSDREPRDNYRRGGRHAGGSRYNEPQKNKQKKVLIISIVALVLVIAILVGVIIGVNLNTVSAKELEAAKENYLPPAQAATIDTSLDDPSNDKIQFKYDDRARIISCTYSANDKTYDQSYSYDDALRKIHIETNYRKHPIFTKDIGYDKVSTANTFESVEGYYIRLDDQCVGASDTSSSVVSKPQATVAPETEAPTDPPTEEPTEEPTEASSDWKELYINALSNYTESYIKGTLIYINDDSIPELVLYSNGFPTSLLWIKDNEVQTTQLGGKVMWYCDHGNHYSLMQSAIYITASIVNYEFDGVNEPSSIYSSIEYWDPDRKETVYKVNGEEVSKDEFSSSSDGYDYQEISVKNLTARDSLPDYIRNFE